ncbi:MAG: hypothetical protein ACRD18_13095 [Terriglobia bacterium]
MPKLMNRWMILALRFIGVSALIFGLFAYGEAHDRGLVPKWGDELFSIGWPVGMVVLALIYFRANGSRAFGMSTPLRFALRPEEELIFAGNFLGGEFYPDADHLPQSQNLLEWIDQKEFSHRMMMKVWVTNYRVLIGTPWGRVQRVIPVADIQSLTAVPSPRPFKRAFIFRFKYMNRSEALRIGAGSRSRGLVHALQGAIDAESGLRSSEGAKAIDGKGHEDLYLLLVVAGSTLFGIGLSHETGHLALFPICVLGGVWLWKEIRQPQR